MKQLFFCCLKSCACVGNWTSACIYHNSNVDTSQMICIDKNNNNKRKKEKNRMMWSLGVGIVDIRSKLDWLKQQHLTVVSSHRKTSTSTFTSQVCKKYFLTAGEFLMLGLDFYCTAYIHYYSKLLHVRVRERENKKKGGAEEEKKVPKKLKKR